MANEEISINCEMYQHLIGRLLYLTHTQLDISYAMSILNQFMHQLKECHLHAAYQVLHYLKGTPRKGVLFKQSEKVEVEMFTDADYAGSTIDQKSIFNHITFVGGNLVTWRSKKQNVGTYPRICELLWVKNLLDKLQIPLFNPMKIYCDNKFTRCCFIHNTINETLQH
ncbi:unnamed protein product [Spirodela intermedia]|uniref:Uncharacterized protein n=1 Tax=Spirodela intermedia TaxID=51605 RepID=A0A7I8I9M2_SPIIN|nr:unnamed protein product [Spirodela intermedia]CAA6654164.1 unnamed protein product [Spirodela intermedia]